MFGNSLFWLCIALLSWSGFCVNTAVSFNGTNDGLKKVLELFGTSGMIVGLVRVVTLSIHFDWWWAIGILVGFFVIMGALAVLIRGVFAVGLSVLGIIGIPIVWWIGGLF